MQVILDFVPIFLFLVAYYFFGMLTATAVAIGASTLQVALYWWMYRKFETMQLITLAIIVGLGGLTLWTKNGLFFQWKPTIAYWAFAIVFMMTHFVGEKTMIQRMMGAQIEVPSQIWRKLNLSWILFFTTLGIVNLYVAYHFSEAVWVSFKFFGAMGLMIVFAIAQSVYLAKYIKEEPLKNRSHS